MKGKRVLASALFVMAAGVPLGFVLNNPIFWTVFDGAVCLALLVAGVVLWRQS